MDDTLRRVFQLLKSKSFAEAEHLLRAYLERYPQHHYGKSLLASVVLKQRRTIEALQIAEEVLQSANEAEALAVKGLALAEMNRMDEALEFLESSLNLRDNDFYRARLVTFLLKAKKPAEAAPHISILLARDPHNRFYQSLSSRLKRAKGTIESPEQGLESGASATLPEDSFDYAQFIRNKLRNKKVAEAISELQLLISLKPQAENPFLVCLLGEFYMKAQKYVEAEDCFRKALTMKPEHDYFRKWLGFSLAKGANVAESFSLLRQSFLANPSDYYVRSVLFSLVTKGSLFDEMEQLLEEALIQHPEVSSLHGLKKRLEKLRKSHDTPEPAED